MAGPSTRRSPLRARRRRPDRGARWQAGRLQRDRHGDSLGAVPHDRRGGRGADAAGRVRRLPMLGTTMLASAGGRRLSLKRRLPERAGGGGAHARHRGAARNEPHDHAQPAKWLPRASSGSAGRAMCCRPAASSTASLRTLWLSELVTGCAPAMCR